MQLNEIRERGILVVVVFLAVGGGGIILIWKQNKLG